ncbi:hypothetical protein GCM10010345_92480 [Streptomyces canarius]|uniref:Uncharacterized protein n=1 Tax=Streptomyces canarius TaxID=285453 RepID=A0ABQ3DGY8_9ACTN|nr:hypothetical protein GCM10010345_92480 [Streptomyces canarius]
MSPPEDREFGAECFGYSVLPSMLSLLRRYTACQTGRGTYTLSQAELFTCTETGSRSGRVIRSSCMALDGGPPSERSVS